MTPDSEVSFVLSMYLLQGSGEVLAMAKSWSASFGQLLAYLQHT